jgi:hypothetical protein
LIVPVLGNESLSYVDNNKSMKKNVDSLSETEFFSNNTRRTTTIPFTNQSTMPITKITNFGTPYQLPLESIKNTTDQKNAINAILKQGYNRSLA